MLFSEVDPSVSISLVFNSVALAMNASEGMTEVPVSLELINVMPLGLNPVVSVGSEKDSIIVPALRSMEKVRSCGLDMSGVNSTGERPMVIGMMELPLTSEKLPPAKNKKQFSNSLQTDVSNLIRRSTLGAIENINLVDKASVVRSELPDMLY